MRASQHPQEAGHLASCVVEDRRKEWGRAAQSVWSLSGVLPQHIPKLHTAIAALSLLPELSHTMPTQPAPWVRLAGPGEVLIPPREMLRASGEAGNKLTSTPVLLPSLKEFLRAEVGFTASSTR